MAKFKVIMHGGGDPIDHEAYYAAIENKCLMLMDDKHLIKMAYAPGEWKRIYRIDELKAEEAQDEPRCPEGTIFTPGGSRIGGPTQ